LTNVSYSHLQTVTGQPAIAGNIGTSTAQRREPTVTAGHIHPIDGSLEPTKPLGLSLTVWASEIFNDECDAVVDMTLNNL